ncbi:metallophosphoesterase [Marinifilum sp. RC60d5]|uniref:metallophosphoesterase n=1 Tax=Marinifilum sp. RC60d5 TaxID=3458414 RepID=UPI0040364A17
MRRILKSVVILLVVFTAFSCKQDQSQEKGNFQIAFMADVHLSDVYGEFQDSDYKGVLNSENGKYANPRTMKAQLHSTRIYNENYFAFLAALDDVANRGIKYVVLPGDFSDDGQPINIRGLQRILNEYAEKYDIKFLATTGNHDPVRPFLMDAGKKDFLGKDGKPQVIMSAEGMYVPKSTDENPVVITKDIAKMGYEQIITTLGQFGFFPQQEDLYWETPFSSYQYNDYSFAKATEDSNLEHRNYTIPPYNTTMPDVSYLVEPVKDIWFLAIDANVYLPKESAENNPLKPANYAGSSIGYSNVLTHKKHLISWVKKVTAEAEKRGKTLIVFSHYPMIDFNDDASDHIKNLMGEGKMQLHRVPAESVAKTFANAGIKLHFGGHMHINDTGIRKFDNGDFLVNVQIPSLAAYIPAYKILKVKSKTLMEIETVVIDSVPRFKELFPLYEQEHAYLEKIGAQNIWNKDILDAKTYHEFTNWHLKELVRLRFLKKDWPVEFRDFLLKATGNELLNVAGVKVADSASFDNWTGFDMIFDFYRLRSADKLAIKDIGIDRIKQYQIIIKSLLKEDTNSNITDDVRKDFFEFAEIFHHFLNGAPADHFQIDLKNNALIDLVE